MADTADTHAPAVPTRTRLDARGGLLLTPLREPFAACGALIYATFVAVALLADVIAPHEPLEILFKPDGSLARSEAPSWQHLLGTTNLGRDVFSQLVVGTRAALVVGLAAAAPQAAAVHLPVAHARHRRNAGAHRRTTDPRRRPSGRPSLARRGSATEIIVQLTCS